MSVTSSFQTDVSTMGVAARHVEEVASGIEAELRGLDNRIQPITSTWRGAAATSYLGLHERWMQDTTKLRTVLSEISTGLQQNANSYQVNEDDVVGQMQRTTTLL